MPESELLIAFALDCACKHKVEIRRCPEGIIVKFESPETPNGWLLAPPVGHIQGQFDRMESVWCGEVSQYSSQFHNAGTQNTWEWGNPGPTLP